MMNKIDWKDIFKSWMTMTSYFIVVVSSWLLFTWTSLLFLLSCINDVQDIGIALGLGLFVAAIACWLAAVILTIKVYNIIIRRVN